jgi:HK97 family phage prohead protease
MNQKTHDIGFEIKEVNKNGTFAGYGSVYSVIDQGDDVIEPGCFKDSLLEWQTKNALPALLWQHDSCEPIGVYTAMREDTNGLYVEGKLALKTQRGAEAYELLQMKAISGLSIGFMTREDSYDQKTGIRTIKKADLWECSLVTFPMNDQARIDAVKSIDQITDFKSASEYLRNACKCSRSEATALVAKLKSLSLRNAAEDDEAQQLIKALKRREMLFKS